MRTHQVSVTPVADCLAPVPEETWYFRGTANGWGVTAMDRVGDGNQFTTCQTFADVPDPRFKIDHFGDWRESYPAEDRRVGDGAHRITFDAATRAISTVAAGDGCGAETTDTWFFRGTANGWQTTAMTPVPSSDAFRLTVAFAGEDPAPRFKVDHFGNWQENYPAEDVRVDDCFTYEITFDRATKGVTATKLDPVRGGACAGPPLSVGASPPAGTYPNPQSVTLAVANADGQDVAVHYTTDGSEPTTGVAHVYRRRRSRPKTPVPASISTFGCWRSPPTAARGGASSPIGSARRRSPTSARRRSTSC